MPMIFHSHPASPPCRSVWLTLKTLGADFTLNEINFFEGEHQGDAFKKINPRATIPALQDGDLSLAESRAIMQYIANKSIFDGGKDDFYPTDPKARAKVDQVLQTDIDFVSAMYKYTRVYEILVLKQEPKVGDEAALNKALNIYEGFLGKTEFLAGDNMTIADLSAACSVSILDLVCFDFAGYPKLKAWNDKMKALPHYAECVGTPSAEIKKMYQALWK